MKLRLVPHAVETRAAEVWLGAFEQGARPPAGALHAAGRSWNAPQADWQPVDAGVLPPGEVRIWVQTLKLDPLAPGTFYELRAEVGGASCAGSLHTLPERLPAPGEPGFVVLLGSCFAEFQSTSRRVGRNALALWQSLRPSIKLLMGDQVYLDNPLRERPSKKPVHLARHLLGKYERTWKQTDPAERGVDGFSALLAHGGTWFLADDHEFWNNHPNTTPLLPTWDEQELRPWGAIATSLWRAFQCAHNRATPQPQKFAIGPLRIALVDTRSSRQKDDAAFMDPAILHQVEDWIAHGEAGTVGVIVLGPTLFTKPAGWFSKRYLDRSLANYEQQYAQLADAVLSSPRSLVVLAGDIHCGRIATAPLRTPHRLVEIVSSPLSLVNDLMRYQPGSDDAPDRFPVRAGALAPARVCTKNWIDGDEPSLDADHFSTLELWQTAQSVTLRVRAWQIRDDGPRERGSWDHTLLLEAS